MRQTLSYPRMYQQSLRYCINRCERALNFVLRVNDVLSFRKEIVRILLCVRQLYISLADYYLLDTRTSRQFDTSLVLRAWRFRSSDG